MNTLLKQLFALLCWLCAGSLCAQYSDGMTGLLHTPSAEMQPDATVMIGGGFLNKELTPNTSKVAWSYHTYNYYLNVTFFKCLEVGYIMTLFKRGVPGIAPKVKFRGQDRHFSVRLRVLKEEQFWHYMPAVVLGVVDPLTSFHTPTETGNGHFNRFYIAVTKHFHIPYGELGVHLSWNYRNRKDYQINAPGIGVSYDQRLVKGLRLIVEYDAKDIYFGAHYRVWRYLLLQAMMQRGQYFSGGATFIIPLKK